MEWVTILVNALVAIVGLVGGGCGIYFWRENKALKQVEVKDAMMSVEMKQAEEWNALYKEERAKNTEKSQRLKSLYAERDALKEDVNALKFKVEQLSWYHCTVNGCLKRRPPHVFDTDGNEVEKK